MKPILKIWETDTRYYKANLYRDLFNDWILEKTWGSKFNHRGAVGLLQKL